MSTGSSWFWTGTGTGQKGVVPVVPLKGGEPENHLDPHFPFAVVPVPGTEGKVAGSYNATRQKHPTTGRPARPTSQQEKRNGICQRMTS